MKFVEYNVQDIVLCLMVFAHELNIKYPNEKWGEFNIVDNELISIITEKLNGFCYYDELSGKSYRFMSVPRDFSQDVSYYISAIFPDGTITPANKINSLEETNTNTPYYQTMQKLSKTNPILKEFDSLTKARKIDVYSFSLNDGLTLTTPTSDDHYAITIYSTFKQKINKTFYKAFKTAVLYPQNFFDIEAIKHQRYARAKMDSDVLRQFYSDYEINFLSKANKYPQKFTSCTLKGKKVSFN
jgi:hypothetical protein